MLRCVCIDIRLGTEGKCASDFNLFIIVVCVMPYLCFRNDTVSFLDLVIFAAWRQSMIVAKVFCAFYLIDHLSK